MADYDVVVIGGGPGGLACSYALASGGARVVVIERERVGGECAFWGCVPSKALLRSAAPNHASKDVPGSRESRAGEPKFAAAAAWRTDLVSAYADDDHAAELRAANVTLVRGDARIVRSGCVAVDDREITCDAIVIATGSEDRLPPIDGLVPGRPFWTSREASAAGEVPKRLIILGGGPIGVEFAQIFAQYGSDVTIVEAAEHLLPTEDVATAELLTKQLEHDGITVRTHAKATTVTWSEEIVTLALADGTSLQAERLLVVTGRKPRVAGFGIEALGVTIDDDGEITIDPTGRAADGVYAVGDVTNVGPFTHVAKYQGRIAAASILGSHAHARTDAIPRCIYTTPEVASVGLTREQAEKAGTILATARVDFDEVTRPVLQADPPPKGALELFADAKTGAIVGGWIVGPYASESIGFVTTAIVGKLSLETLLDVIQPYPTYGEAFYVAVDRLARTLSDL